MGMATLPPRSLLASASGLFSFLLLASALAGQSPGAELRGRVADARDAPIAGAVVLLHAVGEQSGAEVARDTADDAGRFAISFEPEDGPLYFVATRIGGDIFIGQPFRQVPAGELVLRAGAGVDPLRLDGFENAGSSPGSAAVADDAAGHGGWWVGAVAIGLVALIAGIVHRGRHRPPRARELMVEIARLDEQRARVAGMGSEEAYRARRTELRDRLVEALELDHDAHRH